MNSGGFELSALVSPRFGFASVALASAMAVFLAGCGSSGSGGSTHPGASGGSNASSRSGSDAPSNHGITLTGTSAGAQGNGSIVLLPASSGFHASCAVSTIPVEETVNGQTKTTGHEKDFTLNAAVSIAGKQWVLEVGVDDLTKHGTRFTDNPNTRGSAFVRPQLRNSTAEKLPNGADYFEDVAAITLSPSRKSGTFSAEVGWIKGKPPAPGASQDHTKLVGKGTLQGKFSCG